MEKTTQTLRRSCVIGVGLMLIIVLKNKLGSDDSIYDAVLCAYLVQILASIAYILMFALFLLRSYLTGEMIASNKRLLCSALALISCASLFLYSLYLEGTPIVPRGMRITIILSLLEFMLIENQYSYQRACKPGLHRMLTIHFFTLLLASCLPIGLYEGQKLLVKVLAFL